MFKNKYITLLKLSWQNGLAYPFSVITWRVRQMLSTLMSLTVWNVLFTDTQTLFGYTQSSMITYIFLVSFLQSMILASALTGLAQRIYSGELSNQLLKPINIFAYLGVEEIADKIKNVGFLIVETLILFAIFKPEIVFPSLALFLLFTLWAIGGVILNFCITLLFGALGFWSPETWGPRFLFFMIIDFTAGKLFPLDILPEFMQKALMFTPFPYLSFIQIQLFLGRLNSTEVLLYSFRLLAWVLILAVISKLVWKRGLRSYEATGR